MTASELTFPITHCVVPARCVVYTLITSERINQKKWERVVSCDHALAFWVLDVVKHGLFARLFAALKRPGSNSGGETVALLTAILIIHSKSNFGNVK